MWGKRESLTANDNDLISVSLKIIRAPSSGRGRRAKRGGVGFPKCRSTVSRGVYRHRSIDREAALSRCHKPLYHFLFKERII